MNAPLAEGRSQGCCAEWLGEFEWFSGGAGCWCSPFTLPMTSYDFMIGGAFERCCFFDFYRKKIGDMIQFDEYVETNK